MTKVVFAPPNHLPRIEKLWAYLSRDEATGSEGLCAATYSDGSLLPLIAADETRLASLRSMAEQIAAATGKTIVLVEFTGRVDLRKITGAGQ